MPNSATDDTHSRMDTDVPMTTRDSSLAEHRQDILRMSVVYPGHPCLIAMQIMCSFPSYEAASQPTRHGWAEALSCSDVRGAGGAVNQGMELLRLMAEESMHPEEAHSFGCMLWKRSRQGDHPDALEHGEIEAERHRDLFLALSSSWMSLRHAPQEPQEGPGATKAASGMTNTI